VDDSYLIVVLCGLLATGDDREHSDLDLLVVLADESVGRMADLAERLSSRTGRDVQPVRLVDAEGSPPLMSDVLSRGRGLVDRGGRWPDLQTQAKRWRRLADRRERSGIETMDDLLPDREATS